MRDRMQEALRGSGADYAEIRIEREEGTALSFRGAELDQIVTGSSVGGMARALVRGGWGIVTFNDLSELREKLREAAACARLVARERGELAEVSRIEQAIPAPAMERDFRGVPVAEKKRVIEQYNDLMLGLHPRIHTTHASYSDRYRQVYFANSEGSYFEDTRPDVTVALTAVARDGNLVQQGRERVGRAGGFEAAVGLEAKAEAAARRAADLLAAPPVQGGSYTVVLDPQLGGVFAHEAFGHLSEADHVYENEKLRELMTLGKRFGPNHLNIVDDGSLPGGRGTHLLDDEGVPTRKTHLVKDGILVGRLHNRETAAKMGEAVTGNARAVGWSFAPIVRMTNTYIEPGTASFEDLIRDIELGLYARDMMGGQTMMEMFTFSAAYGYMIRSGEVAELVRDVVLTGNVFQTLHNIDLIADDLAWDDGGGGCGKGGQSPLPVGLGSPHVRMREVVVGGRQ
ncbi:MAG TPA: TldD/PmbA family protein [Armatimonadota bacterium]|nr:TldD/PmbA family protein [Armatimonadota bacterium]